MHLALLTFVCLTCCLVNGDTEMPVEKPLELKQSSCLAGDDCDITPETDDIQTDEKTKYSIQHQHLHKDANNNQHQSVDNNDRQEVTTDSLDVKEPATEEIPKDDTTKAPPSLYEFPPLTRLDPVKVGYEVELEVEEGKFCKRITRATHPPVFEIPDFLSAGECQELMDAGLKLGLKTSGLFGKDINDEIQNTTDNSQITRISDQTWIKKANISPQLWKSLYRRLSAITEMPEDFLYRSEAIQLVKYVPGGHYHAHLDTSDNSVENSSNLPCCFQTRCGAKELTAQGGKCCRLCRYFTVMYYLSDVEEGGETAFPLADMEEELYQEKITNMPRQSWYNLSKFCYNASVIVTPRKGSAMFWYSHFVDEQTGYLGKADLRSNHGGCDVIKGNKWIANNFISAPTFEDRFKASVWYLGA